MGSTPSEELIKELESEAYLAILRAVEVNPHVDSLVGIAEIYISGKRSQTSQMILTDFVSHAVEGSRRLSSPGPEHSKH